MTVIVVTEYRLVIRPEIRAQFSQLQRLAAAGTDPMYGKTARAGIAALKALRHGKERDARGERLGYSPKHYDLRDCAEIKIAVFDERGPKGKRLGPSHRMIYREFEGTADDPRPIREIISFEHRKDGKPFQVAAMRLGRTKSNQAAALAGLPNTTPAVGKNKKRDRPTSPYRMPLPPDIAAALSTAQRTKPTRPKSTPAPAAISRAGPQPPSRDRSS